MYTLLFVFLAVSASLLWSIYTVRGTALLLKSIVRILPNTIEIKKITGRLGNSLHLEGFSLRLPESEMTINTADLKWQPFYLITGKLSISSLEIRGVSITDKNPHKTTPYDLSLPKIPAWLTMMHGWINDLTVDNVQYIGSDREPLIVNDLSAKILWRQGTLYVNEMNAKTSSGTIRGSAMINLASPALRTQLKINLRKNIAGMDTVSLNADLPASKGEEQIAGQVFLKAAAGERERFGLECRLAIARHAVSISRAKLMEKDRKGNVEAEGVLDVSGSKPAFTLSAKITELDLAPEVTVDTDLSGNLDIWGTMENYRGKFNLRNKSTSWKQIELGGNIYGVTDRIELTDVQGKYLGGTLLGELHVSRNRDITLSAHFKGKNLNAAKIRPGLQGNLNVDWKGQLRIPDNLPMEGSLTATLLESHFQKRVISGTLDAVLHSKTVKINALAVKGNGFAVMANGIVQERLSYEIRIDDASKLFPDATGNLFAKGWVRWLNNESGGVVAAKGKNIAYCGVKASAFNAAIQIQGGYKGDVTVDATGRNVSYGSIQADLVSLQVNGKTGDHRINLAVTHDKDRVDALAEGKYADGAWQGAILKASGREALFGSWALAGPSTVNISKKRIALSPFSLASTGGDRIDIRADILQDPTVGVVAVKWQNINLARANRFIGQPQFEGRTTGSLQAEWLSNKRLVLSGEIGASGALSQKSMKLNTVNVNSRLNWDRSGLVASCDIDLADAGRINATISSKEPASFSVPTQGTLQTVWKAIDIGALQPVFPGIIRVKGRLSGEAKGNFLPGSRFDLSGKTNISGGSFSWLVNDGEITAPIKEAAIQWTWKDTSLKGKINLVLAQYGHAEGSIQIPLVASFPVKINRDDPIMVSTKGQLREKGLLSAFFPGLVQETSGRMDFSLIAGRTFADPQVNGNLNLSSASAYLPSAGIRLQDVSAEVLFNKDQITITSFLMRSGPGYIGGNAAAQLKNWHINTFRGTLKGEKFQAVNLPELQVSISPELKLSGTAKNVSLSGSILIPDALIWAEQKDMLVKTSSDIVIKSRKEKLKHTLPLSVDSTVAVTLGDRVLVKAYGIDTRLTGQVNVTMKEINDIRASGNISTVNGKYNAYGVKLDIKRGRIVFSGDPVDQATLDIRAIRKISNDISAGVQVTGTPAYPLVNLYSDPSMPDLDILSYIVLGRQRGSGQGDKALLARVAGSLLTTGRSSANQNRLIDRLGLDTIDVESTDGTLSQSIIKVGKYLSPELYISYGRSIFTGENLFGAKYNLSKRWDIESTMGNESSAVIYYKVEFN